MKKANKFNFDAMWDEHIRGKELTVKAIRSAPLLKLILYFGFAASILLQSLRCHRFKDD